MPVIVSHHFKLSKTDDYRCVHDQALLWKNLTCLGQSKGAWKNAAQNSKETTQHSIKQSLQNDRQDFKVSEYIHILVSAVLAENSMELVISIVLVWNAKYKVLQRREYVSKKDHENVFEG